MQLSGYAHVAKIAPLFHMLAHKHIESALTRDQDNEKPLLPTY